MVKKLPHILPERGIKARLSSPARNDASHISRDPFLSVSGIRCRRKVFKSKDSTINCSRVNMIGSGSYPSDADVKTQFGNTSSCGRRLCRLSISSILSRFLAAPHYSTQRLSCFLPRLILPRRWPLLARPLKEGLLYGSDFY